MHIDDLPISSAATDNRSNDDQCVFVYKIPYTSLVLGAVAGVCDEVEFKSLGKREDDEKD
jgi:hypothetical protein